MHGFELLKKVAEGSAAEAFLARAPGADHSVLVEVSRAEVLDDIELYGRFLDRAVGRKAFRHPHLLTCESAGCAPDGRVYITTEAVEGPTLADQLATDGPLDVGAALRLMSSLCEAVEYLHVRKVVHGNLCPKNVYLVGPSGLQVPKLLDMGLLLFRSNRSVRTPLKLELVGAPYLSPERAAGRRGDIRSDVYGLGVLLYELVTGRPPFAARSLHTTAPIPILPPAIAALAPVIARCLAKTPSHRFGSAREVQLAIDAVLSVRDVQSTLDLVVEVEPLPRALPPPLPKSPPLPLATTEPAGPLQPQTANLRAPGPKPAPKPVVGGYEILRPLGEGGMGRVFLCRHLKLGNMVALKTLKPAYANDPVQIQRFIQEARTIHRVKHPNLVEIYDFFEDQPGRVCCVMEPLFGETVSARAKRAPLTIAQVVSIVRQTCAALTAVHAAGVIHRDLKPENLFLVEKDGAADFVKVFDFGIARVNAGSLVTTRVGEVVGTPAYMAPEQTMPGPLDGRADIYSLGTVMFVLLQGYFPYDATEPDLMLALKVRTRADAIGGTAKSGEVIPRALRAVIDRCLQRSPNVRFPTMAALSEALAPFEAPAPVPPLAPLSRSFWKPGAGALALAAAAWWWAGRGEQPAISPPPPPPAAAATVAPPEPPVATPAAVQPEPAVAPAEPEAAKKAPPKKKAPLPKK